MTNPFDDRLDDEEMIEHPQPASNAQKPPMQAPCTSPTCHQTPLSTKHTPTVRTIRTHPNEETIPRNLANLTDEEWLRSRRQFLNLDCQYRIGRDEDGEKCL